MLFALIDCFLDRFSPLPQGGLVAFDRAEFGEDGVRAQHRLMDRYYDNANTRRPTGGPKEPRC